METFAVIPAAENVLSGRAFRPGDVVTTLAGKTIEITNPDAEGRLLLADALTHARSLGATHLVDLATLTGAVISAFGDLFAAVFAGDDDWRAVLVAAGEASGDRLWPMPLDLRYRAVVESNLADLKNSPGKGRALPIFAGYFLREFAGEDRGHTSTSPGPSKWRTRATTTDRARPASASACSSRPQRGWPPPADYGRRRLTTPSGQVASRAAGQLPRSIGPPAVARKLENTGRCASKSETVEPESEAGSTSWKRP